MRSAVQVAAMMDGVRRAPARLVSNLDFVPADVGADEGPAAPEVAAAAPIVDPGPAPSPVARRPSATPILDDRGRPRPHRLDADGVRLFDQRELPGRIHELPCPSAASVAAAIQAFAVAGGPILGEVAAEAVALAAQSADGSSDDRDRSRLGWTIGLLRSARPSSAYLQAALDAVEQLLDSADVDLGASLADRAAAVAVRVAAETEVACGRLARVGATALASGPAALASGADPLRVLTHGATGELSGGRTGTVTGILDALHRERAVFVWIAESRPSLLGARIGTLELERAGIPYGLIADATAASLMAAGEVDVVLVAAERVAGNGDVAAISGTYALAVLAHRHGVPFHVCAIRAAFDPSVPDGGACPTERLPIQALTTYRGARIAATAGAARTPWLDLTPSAFVTSFFTDDGVVA